MHRQVVEHDHVAGTERRHQHLFDVGAKRRRVEWAIEDRGRHEAVEPQAGHDRMRLPMTTRRVVVQSRATRAAPIPAQQIGRDAALIEKNVLAHIAQGLPRLPLATGRGDIRPALFVGVYGFF